MKLGTYLPLELVMLLCLEGCSTKSAPTTPADGALSMDSALRDAVADLLPTDQATPDAGPPRFSRQGRSWQLEEVDTIGGAPIFPAIAMGQDQSPVIAFRKGTASKRYPVIVRRAGPGWGAPETVEEAEGAFLGKSPSIAIDASGGVHLTYYNEDEERLRHAFQPAAGAPWQLSYPYPEEVDAGDHSALAIDGQGRLHCSFLQYSVYHTIYGLNDQGQWSFSPLARDGVPQKTYEATMAVDAAGQAQLAVADEQERLYFARGGVEGWSFETIDEVTPDIGHYLDSALDPGDRLHIIYMQWTHDHPSIWAGRRGDGGWQVEQVDQELGISYAAAIAVLADGTELIAYARNLGEGGDGLWFGYRDPEDQKWSLELVDGSTYVSGTDLLAAVDGTLYLVYFDETSYILKTAILPP